MHRELAIEHVDFPECKYGEKRGRLLLRPDGTVRAELR